MMVENEQSLENTDDEFVSKTSRKREMQLLQDMGKKLTELNSSELANIPLSDNLHNAITEMHRIKSNEAKRRHLQYIGKLMRLNDVDDIKKALSRIDQAKELNTRQFHRVEHWRDKLLEQQDSALQEFLKIYPHSDRNQLRQLVRQAKRQQQMSVDNQQIAKKGAKLKLFRYIKELMEEAILLDKS